MTVGELKEILEELPLKMHVLSLTPEGAEEDALCFMDGDRDGMEEWIVIGDKKSVIEILKEEIK